MSKNITENDDITVYEIKGTIPDTELTTDSSKIWKRTYIGTFSILFGAMFIALIGFLLYLLFSWLV